MLALVHAKGNMLYALGNNAGAAAAFEEAILIAAGPRRHGMKSLIKQTLDAFTLSRNAYYPANESDSPREPILLHPDKALQTASLVFPPYGNPPGLQYVAEGLAKKAAISTTSNCVRPHRSPRRASVTSTYNLMQAKSKTRMPSNRNNCLGGLMIESPMKAGSCVACRFQESLFPTSRT